jgi:hypothetical protein
LWEIGADNVFCEKYVGRTRASGELPGKNWLFFGLEVWIRGPFTKWPNKGYLYNSGYWRDVTGGMMMTNVGFDSKRGEAR